LSFILAEDAALKNYLQGMTVADEKAPVRPVKVWFGYPDVEVRTQSYPYVVIELVDIVPAHDRQMSGIIYDNDNRGTVAPVNGVSYGYMTPLPYDLVYQITTYSRHPRHDRAILFQMQQKFPSQYGSLVVPNALNTESAYRHMFLDGFLKRDQIEDGKRLFRGVYTVRIVSEMTPVTANNAISNVQTVEINRVTTNIPAGLIPVSHLTQGD
jgi:hypothetical protein